MNQEKNEGMTSLKYNAHLCSIMLHNYRALRVSASLLTEYDITKSCLGWCTQSHLLHGISLIPFIRTKRKFIHKGYVSLIATTDFSNKHYIWQKIFTILGSKTATGFNTAAMHLFKIKTVACYGEGDLLLKDCLFSWQCCCFSEFITQDACLVQQSFFSKKSMSQIIISI